MIFSRPITRKLLSFIHISTNLSRTIPWPFWILISSFPVFLISNSFQPLSTNIRIRPSFAPFREWRERLFLSLCNQHISFRISNDLIWTVVWFQEFEAQIRQLWRLNLGMDLLMTEIINVWFKELFQGIKTVFLKKYLIIYFLNVAFMF